MTATGQFLLALDNRKAGGMNPDPFHHTAAAPSAEEEVRAAVSARAKALASGDVEALADLMHPECVWTTHAGLVLRRDEYICRNTTTVRWRAQQVDVDAVVISEGTAVVVGTVTDTVVEDQEDARYRMPITMVWIRDKHWRLLAAHAGPRT